jgi:hypothetical protein
MINCPPHEREVTVRVVLDREGVVKVAVHDRGTGVSPGVTSSGFSRPSTRLNATGWASDCQSVEPSSRFTADACGWKTTPTGCNVLLHRAGRAGGERNGSMSAPDRRRAGADRGVAPRIDSCGHSADCRYESSYAKMGRLPTAT